MRQQLTLTLEDAQTIINAILALLTPHNKGASIAVVDVHGELIAFSRTDTCRLPSITIAINKAYTAAREHKTSRALGESSREKQFPMTNFGELRYVSWGGGVPVIVEGQVVGAVGVSGLPEEEDMHLAAVGIQALLG